MDHVKDLWSSYLQWVAEHPQLATDIETSIKWISYIATGKKQWTLWFLSKTFLTKIQNCISKKSEKENLLLPTFCMVSQNSWVVCNVFPIQIFWTVVQIVLTIMLWQVFVCFTAPILNFCQECYYRKIYVEVAIFTKVIQWMATNRVSSNSYSRGF